MKKRYKLTHMINAFNLNSFNNLLGEKIKQFQSEGYNVEIQFSTIYIPKSDKCEEETIGYTALLLMY